MKIIIKIILACLLFGCLLKMPYGYYEFIRWACCAEFISLAYEESKRSNKLLIIPLIAAIILFNPIAPVYLKKETWHPIDVSIAVLLIIWTAIDFFKSTA